MGIRFFVSDSLGWSVIEARWTEALSEVPVYSLDLLALHPGVDPDELLGAPATVDLRRGALTHHRGGVVVNVCDLGVLASRRVVRIDVAPELWLLGQRSDQRIFQDVDVIDIVRDVLRDAEIYQGDGALRIEVAREKLARREYCVQYNETDLAFVMRLLEQEGLTFYFRHDGMHETLVVFDAETDRWDDGVTLDGGAIPLDEERPELRASESIQRLHWNTRLAPTGVTLRDYNFTSPAAVQNMTRAAGESGASRRLYQFPGGYALGGYAGERYQSHNGARLASNVLGAQTAQSRVGRGGGVVTGFEPGRRVSLTQVHREDLDGQRYILTRVEHRFRGQEEAAHDTAVGTREGARYDNLYECIPAAVVFRPACRTPRPLARGAETAMVMALPGSTEEICTDPYGRVLVQFHWDRPELRTVTQQGKQSSCWIRVASSWSGGTWGMVTTPRVGMEVVVHFLDGDPDRPLVTGCVFNGANGSAIDLPTHRTRTTFRTNSSPGGGGFNELTFEDAAGTEHVFLHAQKDLNEVVRNDHSTRVLNDQTNHVVRDQGENIDRHQTMTVGGNRTKVVVGDERSTVRGDRARTVVGNQDTTVEKSVRSVIQQNAQEAIAGMQSQFVGMGRLLVKKLFGIDINEGPQANAVIGPRLTTSTESIKHSVMGISTVHLDEAGMSTRAPEITLKAGDASTLIKAGKTKITLSSGKGAKIVLDGTEVSIEATTVKINGSAVVDVKGGLIKLNS
jgi:type VI secretion system secreted protein VgrG